SDYEEIFIYHTDPLKPNPNVKYALDLGLEKYIDVVKPLDNDGVQDSNEKQFVELMASSREALDVPTFINYLREKASDGRITREELEYSSNFAGLVKGIYSEIYKAKNLYENNTQFRITDPLKTIDYSTSLGLRLGFDRELAKDATAKAIGYYGIAVVDRELPEDFNEISLLTKATQIDKYGDKLIDFSPIVFYSVDGNNFVLTPDAGRETWMLAKHLKLIMESGFNILEHPEMFEGLNGKIIANTYSIFDAKYGVNYAEQTLNRRTLKPIDNDVWDLITLQWSLYSNKAPQLGGENKLYNRDFPWYDSDKLDTLYRDPNTRRQALFFLFYIDNGTFDMERARKFHSLTSTLPREVSTDLYELLMWQRTVPNPCYQPIYPNYTAHSMDDILKWIDLVTYEKKLIDENTAEKLKNEVKTLPPHFTPVGVEGAKTALIQAEKEYEAISKLYPNGKVILPYTRIPADPRAVYYDWVNDRGFHGLWNTHIQFLGMDPQTLLDINRNSPYEYWGNPQKYVENHNGVDQYITKNWKYWDLVKFAMGYERWNKTNFPGMYERYTINYTIPQTLKAFGFPDYWVRIEPTPEGAANYEWVASLPDYIANKLKSEFNDKVIIGPANGFGLYLCKEGMIKDGISEIFGFGGGTGLLADKQPSLGLGSNFRFYFLKK
ncbi:MAG: hypothetical protein NDF52_07400, partial [archaeon YNP-WB-062]|nr:hypothetical protein [Candidatus Culexarchaeum yellowstonense]